MNYLVLGGHLGADPEVRFTSSGKKVTTIRVAVNSRRGDKEETTWWRVTFWEEQFAKVLSFCKKGSAVIVAGEMQKPELFTDREGKTQISLNMTGFHLQFSPFGRPASQQERQEGNSMPFGGPQPGKMPAQEMPSLDEEIPF